MTDQREQEMQNKINVLAEENAYLKEQLATLRKLAFGAKTERTKRILGDVEQLNLFNEAETEAKKSEAEPMAEVRSHQRRKKQKDHWKELLAKYPHEEIVETLPEAERFCDHCGSEMVSMGREKIRTEVEFIPAKVKVIDYYRESFQCLPCRKDEHFSVKKPDMPQPVLAHSVASPSSIAHIAVQKYQFAMPLYRQEQEWKRIGLPLSRATLANWLIRSAEQWLYPLTEKLQEELLSQPIVHADETPVQVLHEPNHKNTSKSYMWVFTSGECETKKKIRLYNYRPGRSGEFAQQFFAGYRGLLQTDAYTGYEKVPCKEHVFCWAHVRRKFVDAMPKNLSPEQKAKAISPKAIQTINDLFEEESKLTNLSIEEREMHRLQFEKQPLEAFFLWLKTIQPDMPQKSALGGAVAYALNHEKGLCAYLHHGEAALSNNICERAIRPFTIGRKNWLFSNSPKGAKASAAFYSIIETSKANGLDPYKYLKLLFETMPNLSILLHPERLDTVLPWNEDVQQNCK